jgi:hypothetical protein
MLDVFELLRRVGNCLQTLEYASEYIKEFSEDGLGHFEVTDTLHLNEANKGLLSLGGKLVLLILNACLGNGACHSYLQVIE